MTDSINRIRIAWWNTGLTPRKGKPTDDPAYRTTAAQVIEDLVTNYDADICAFAETSPTDLHEIQSKLSSPRRMLADEADKTGLCILTRESSIHTVNWEVLIDSYADKTLKRGIRILVSLANESYGFHLFICHWPSRMQQNQSVHERHKLAEGITSRLNEHRTASSDLPAIVIGDFNDEPFDDSVSAKLLGSRDRGRVLQRKSLLYNPFWRMLGERSEIESAEPQIGAGTMFYAGDHSTRWFTMDQALVSRHFLGVSNWRLNESQTDIVHRPPLLGADGSIAGGFNHLPIILTLEKMTDNKE